MSEVLVRFTERIAADDGTSYLPQACGRVAGDGLWEGWIEFVSPTRTLRSPRETEQPNRADLVYWAEGLTFAYLEGALDRALAARPVTAPAPEPASSIVSRPAAAPRRTSGSTPRAVLDPFTAYAEGEELLRGQLRALSRDHVVNIIKAYELPVDTSQSISHAALVDGVVAAVGR
ncbi:MAG TPA: hypothetical protein VJW73_05870 [Gemmatimonadaceae bacterium]|nr:hypothetical protein [Gemmatimonadaceae bacterium]